MMKIRATIILALTISGALALSGCSSQAADTSFTPPGLELNGSIVAPPGELPEVVIKEETENEETTVSCTTINTFSDYALQEINNPRTPANKIQSASLTGEPLVKVRTMAIESSYPKQFGWLIEGQLESGKIVWFGGSKDYSNEQPVYFMLDSPGSIFGAEPASYETFAFGATSYGPDSAIVRDGQEVVKKFSSCFSY